VKRQGKVRKDDIQEVILGLVPGISGNLVM